LQKQAPISSPWRTAVAGRTGVSAVLWLAGAAIAFVAGTPDAAGWLRIRLDPAGLILMAAAAAGGWNFFPKALRSVRRVRLDMNFLMTVATIGALLIGEPFEAAAIATLFSVAELLEAAAVFRARRSIEELVRVVPETARIVGPDRTEREAPASTLRVGQRVRVRPGEKIPIDGKVLDGHSAVDESTVTGESVPATRGEGDAVFAGTIAADGYLEIEATRDAGDTTVDRIVRLVRQAQMRRAPVERTIEKFARVYTPAVTALAALTMIGPPLLGWGTGLDWFTRGLTLLVVACPCALVIATPVTVVSAITSAARHGVLIKGGEYLEALGATRAIALDKTGSLTEGRLTVTDVEGVGATRPEEVLRMAATLEQRSSHPIARAICEHARAQAIDTGGLSVSGFQSQPGRGVAADVQGSELRAGTPELFPGLEPPTRFLELERSGRTVVLVGKAERFIGLIALADATRPAAAAVLQRLRRMGVRRQVMLTGDQPVVAHAIAQPLGMTDVRASLMPEDKAAAIEELRRQHDHVAMLGDGVNDAPALAAASVGIAMGAAGSPAAIETADIALMADDLAMLPYAIHLAKLTRRTIRFNITLALGLKLALAAGAIAGTVSLLVAVLFGDLGASLVVTLNAMRLAGVKPD